ncbi:hypothetical protein VT84_21615 [Gemmata sp. SH-PL17]|uniref:hypothetical protein n=1 Tax=Gemmata sp. SH-PL17 TaxID=1630693 RepID=UPI00078DECEE|nr:hypothetical protein [Gemmata sp. SH-PL17]AMV27015.1 hypothetical protein VT84_21615 [Gemmata sp. SH-PL17]
MRTAEQNARARITYETAYSILPRRAHTDIEELKSEFDVSPDLGALFYFLEAAKRHRTEPNNLDVRSLRGHTGRIGVKLNYIVVEYPRFPAVNVLENLSDSSLITGYVLAPYFSAIVEDRFSSEVQCFVLGQSPDARTTLRIVSPIANTNLGDGCEPDLGAFLELLAQRIE